SSYAIKGVVPAAAGAGWLTGLLTVYQTVQQTIGGPHLHVENAVAQRGAARKVRAGGRELDQRIFYWPVRAWNLFGDNTRFYAIGVLAWTHHITWFPWFVLVPMNAAFVVVWMWQSVRDRAFLHRIGWPSSSAVL